MHITDESSKIRQEEFERLIKQCELQEKNRNYRIENAKKYIKKYDCIFLYESGPLDYFQKWNHYCSLSHKLYNEEMLGEEPFVSYYNEMGENARDVIKFSERLLIFGLTHFSSYFVNDFRGNRLKYCFVNVPYDGQNFHEPKELVICYKADNNGTCYAFSYNPDLEKLIPHDYDMEWKLFDASHIKH